MFSIIICTYNPNPENLKRVLSAINQQSLPQSEWECIIVDNNSKESIQTFLPENLTYKIQFKKEEILGLTSARLCGIRAAKNPWIVFVDDDNVIQPDYLEYAKGIIISNNKLGVIGGCILPEFEMEPKESLVPYLNLLGLRHAKQDHVCKTYELDYTPIGAGMVIKKEVAEYYTTLIENDPLRRSLDRKGNSLMSSGDFDMAHCAIDLGYEMGVFAQLGLIHIIPKSRIEIDYLKRIMYFVILSNHLLFYIRFKRFPTKPNKWRTLIKYLRLIKRNAWNDLIMLRARNRGTLAAIVQIKKLQQELGN